MIEQTAMDFGASDRVERWWGDLHRVLQVAFDRVGLKEMAFRMNCQPSLLADQIAERNSKALRMKQVLSLLDASAPAAQDEIITAIVLPAGYERPVRKIPATPAEELRELRAHLKREAPGVLRDFEKNR